MSSMSSMSSMTSIYPVKKRDGTTVWVHRYRVPTGDPKRPYRNKSKTYYRERDAEQARAAQPTIAKRAKRMKLGEFVSAFWQKRSPDGTTVWVHRYRVPTGDPKRPYRNKSKTYYRERDAEQARAAQPTIAKRAKRMKLGEFVSAFWQKRSTEQHHLSTKLAESSRLTNYLLPYFGQRYLDRITQSDVATYLSNLEGKRGDKGELSGRSKQNLFGLLHSILQYAVELGQLEKNPIARALGSRRNIVRPMADKTEKPILSAEDIWAIIGKVEDRFIPMWLPI